MAWPSTMPTWIPLLLKMLPLTTGLIAPVPRVRLRSFGGNGQRNRSPNLPKRILSSDKPWCRDGRNSDCSLVLRNGSSQVGNRTPSGCAVPCEARRKSRCVPGTLRPFWRSLKKGGSLRNGSKAARYVTVQEAAPMVGARRKPYPRYESKVYDTVLVVEDEVWCEW
jgi:hypothetical protein